jgi:hypothetical protein
MRGLTVYVLALLLFVFFVSYTYWVLLHLHHRIIYCTVLLNWGSSQVMVKRPRRGQLEGGNSLLSYSDHPLLGPISYKHINNETYRIVLTCKNMTLKLQIHILTTLQISITKCCIYHFTSNCTMVASYRFKTSMATHSYTIYISYKYMVEDTLWNA